MKYAYTVKHNGILYMAGMDVPAEETKEKIEEPKTEAPKKAAVKKATKKQ